MAAKVNGHASTVASNILALTKGVQPVAKYSGGIDGIAITIGSKRGSGYVSMYFTIPFGDCLVSWVKGRDLMTSMSQKELLY